MKKGQLSFDMLITLIIAVIVISAFTQLIITIKTNQETVLIKDQLKTIAEKTANLITTTQTLEGTNYFIETKISKINYADANGLNKKTYPKILIEDNNKIIFYEILPTGEKIDANAYFYKPVKTQIITDKVSTSGILTIKNT